MNDYLIKKLEEALWNIRVVVDTLAAQQVVQQSQEEEEWRNLEMAGERLYASASKGREGPRSSDGATQGSTLSISEAPTSGRPSEGSSRLNPNLDSLPSNWYQVKKSGNP